MSGLSLLLLNQHRAHPETPSYANKQLQWAYGLAALDTAYQTLIDRGLVREVGRVSTVFHLQRPEYRLTTAGLVERLPEHIDAMAIWQRTVSV